MPEQPERWEAYRDVSRLGRWTRLPEMGARARVYILRRRHCRTPNPVIPVARSSTLHGSGTGARALECVNDLLEKELSCDRPLTERGGRPATAGQIDIEHGSTL